MVSELIQNPELTIPPGSGPAILVLDTGTSSHCLHAPKLTVSFKYGNSPTHYIICRTGAFRQLQYVSPDNLIIFNPKEICIFIAMVCGCI